MRSLVGVGGRLEHGKAQRQGEGDLNEPDQGRDTSLGTEKPHPPDEPHHRGEPWSAQGCRGR